MKSSLLPCIVFQYPGLQVFLRRSVRGGANSLVDRFHTPRVTVKSLLPEIITGISFVGHYYITTHSACFEGRQSAGLKPAWQNMDLRFPVIADQFLLADPSYKFNI